MSGYEKTILKHYASVADQFGLSSQSTLVDEIARKAETDAILSFVGSVAPKGRILDVGCGNGFTLAQLREKFPDATIKGLEFTPELLSLAQSRFPDGSVTVEQGDVRQPIPVEADVIICQRVLINLLDPSDQKKALENLIDAVPIGGHLLFLEAFAEPLENLNKARAEFDLDPIPPAHHNLYLTSGFFDNPRLFEYRSVYWHVPSNFLSSHYFATRVLHSVLLGDRPVVRNSLTAAFLSGALVPAVGDYAQIKLHAVQRSS